MEKNSIVLRRAKDVIKTEGWTKGTEGMNTTGPACLLGAIGRVIGAAAQVSWNNHRYIPMERVMTTEPARALAACIVEKDRERTYYSYDDAVWKFNDLHAQKQDDVLRMLNDCANREEAAGR